MSVATCSIHAIAIMTAMDRVPPENVFRQLPKWANERNEDHQDNAPLLSLLQGHIDQVAVASGRVRGAPGVHSYVNRLLRRAAEINSSRDLQLNRELTSSHFFRRGAAQAANANSKISLQWILDRGGWQLSSLNRGFIYIFNTTSEVQQVGKVLSGWEPDTPAWQPQMEVFDQLVQAQLRSIVPFVFRCCDSSAEPDFTFHSDVLMQLLLVLLFHYPEFVKVNTTGRYRQHMRWALAQVDYREHELLCWSLVLKHARVEATKSAVTSAVDKTAPSQAEKNFRSLLVEQTEILRALVDQNQSLERRTEKLELQIEHLAQMLSGRVGASLRAPHESTHPPVFRDEGVGSVATAAVASVVPVKRRKAAKQSPADIWVAWFTSQPPIWQDPVGFKGQRVSDFKGIVSYMRLFFEDGYVLKREDASYRAEVRRLGQHAEVKLQQLLARHGESGKSYGTALKKLKALMDVGALRNLEDRLSSLDSLKIRRHETCGYYHKMPNTVRKKIPIMHNYVVVSPREICVRY